MSFKSFSDPKGPEKFSAYFRCHTSPGIRSLALVALAGGVLAGCWSPAASGMPPCVREVDAAAIVRVSNLDWKPDAAKAHELLERALEAARRQQWGMASKLVERAITLDEETDPASREYYSLRAKCREELGDAGPARATDLYNQALLASNAGKRDLARRLYDEALTEDPELLWAANNRSWLDSTDPGTGTEIDAEASIMYSLYACTKSGWRNWSFLDTLGAALAKNGRFDEAEMCAVRAQELAPAERQGELADAAVGYRRGLQRREPEPDTNERGTAARTDSERSGEEASLTNRTESTEIFRDITEKQILEILQGEGYAAEPLTPGMVSWRIEGFKAQVFISEDGTAIQFHSSFDDDDADLRSVNEWNKQYRFSSCYLDDEGDPHLELDLDLAGGVTNERIVDFLKTCRLSFSRWIEEVIN